MQTDCAGAPRARSRRTTTAAATTTSTPRRAAGSYLATHWNTYDNAFLAPCGEVAPACGGGQLWVPEPPAATNAPSVAGSARRGSTLSARTGSWSNGPKGYGYQWQRLSGNAWEEIDDATGATYVPNSEDLGRRLRVAVIATNDDGSASAASNPTAPIGAAGVNRAASKTSAKGKKKKSGVKAKSSKKSKKKSSKKNKKGSKRR